MVFNNMARVRAIVILDFIYSIIASRLQKLIYNSCNSHVIYFLQRKQFPSPITLPHLSLSLQVIYSRINAAVNAFTDFAAIFFFSLNFSPIKSKSQKEGQNNKSVSHFCQLEKRKKKGQFKLKAITSRDLNPLRHLLETRGSRYIQNTIALCQKTKHSKGNHFKKKVEIEYAYCFIYYPIQ